MSDHDPLQKLWTQQTQEPFTMSLADIHERAQQFQTRVQRRNWIEHAASVVVIAAFAYVAWVVPDWGVRVGAGLIILGTLYVMWKLSTFARAATIDEKNEARSWADFHRAELVRQRDVLTRIWSWYLGPFVPGIVVFWFAMAFAPSVDLPLGARLLMLAQNALMGGGIFAAIAWLNGRAAKRLGREIEALDRTRDL
ncbi:MAG: hypothetical protein R3C27_03040 [Hyphomonadaceae bacterium]